MKRLLKTLTNLLGRSASRGRSLPARRKPSRRLEVEMLETRLVPVVGAYGLAPVAAPGLGFDGVVAILAPGNKFTNDSDAQLLTDITKNPDIFSGSGALLQTGRHILTAAHVVDHGTPDHIADSGLFKVVFETKSGTFIYDVPSSNIAIAPGWDGNPYADGHDLAIMTLPSLAPLDADRYSVDYVPDEVGKELIVSGFGDIGTEDSGEQPNTLNVRTYGHNIIDDLGQDVSYGGGFLGIGSTQGPFGTLEYHFGNGDPSNDPTGHTVFPDEAFPAHGDSGGPVFVDFNHTIGSRQMGFIAGVTSFSDTKQLDPGDGFGVETFATRVSDYQGWISQVTGNYPYELTLDLSKQPHHTDGTPDTVWVTVSPDATVHLYVNGYLASQDPISELQDLHIYGSNNPVNITFEGALERPGGLPILINGGSSGRSTLTIDDSSNIDTDRIDIKAGELAFDTYWGSSDFVIAQDSFAALTIDGTGLTTHNILHPVGNTFTVEDTPRNATVSLLTGGNADKVYVQGVSSPLVIEGQGGDQSVFLGNGDSLVNIKFGVSVTNATGFTYLDVQGSAGGADLPNVQIGTSGWGGYILGLAPAPILYGLSGSTSISIASGGGKDVFDIQHAAVPLSITTGNGSNTVTVEDSNANAPINLDFGTGLNTVTVGGPYNLDGIQGPVSMTAPGGSINLTIDDSLQPYAATYTLTGSTFQRAGSGLITFADVTNLVVKGGQGQSTGWFGPYGNTFNVTGTLPAVAGGAFTSIFTGPGSNAVNVTATAGPLEVDFQNSALNYLTIGSPGKGLDPIQGAIYLANAGAGLAVNVDDSGTTTAHAITIDKTHLSRTGAADIAFGSAQRFSLSFTGGSGGNAFHVQGAPGTGSVILLPGTGGDTIYMGSADNKLSNLGYFVINTSNGGNPDLYLFDQGETTDQTYTFDSVSNEPYYSNIPVFTCPGTTIVLVQTNGDTITPGQVGIAALLAGSGTNTVTITDAWAADNVAVDGGTGNNAITGGAGRELLIGGAGANVIRGGSGQDILVAGSVALGDAQTEVAALTAIMAEWGRSDADFATRVTDLLYGGGLNGTTVLNPMNVVADDAGSTLLGGADLDLFFGSLARDSSNYDPARGDVFIDPEAFQSVITIDATALGGKPLFVDGSGHGTGTPISVTLLPGRHSLNANGGNFISFTVALDGTIDYDPSLDGILSGRGTNSLTISAVSITLDDTAPSGRPLFLDGGTYGTGAPISVTLLPGSHRLQTGNSNAVYFTVNLDGTIDYDPSLDGILSGRGTNTLTIAAAVSLDATALSGTGLDVDGVAYDPSAPVSLRLFPGSHYVETASGAAVYFTVAADGTICYDPSLEGILSGAGTNALTVNGAAIALDTTALSGSGLDVDGMAYDPSAPVSLHLLPGTHYVETTSGAAVYFTVAADGTVTYDPTLEGVLSGAGTNALAVNGAAVTVNATALSGSGLDLDGVAYDPSAPFSVSLLPGSHYLETTSGAAVYFTVAADGTISYDPSLDGILSGAGSNALTVNGAAITLDATTLSSSGMDVDGVAYDSSAPISLSLLPGSHYAETASGAAVYFTVAADGTVSYDPTLEGVLSGAGTNALTVNGAVVAVNATALSGSGVDLDGVGYDASAPFTVVLLPGSHYLETASGAAVYFNIAADGTVSYDPSLEGILSGTGTNALTVNGASITLDATALSGSGMDVDGVAYDPSAPVTISLLPGSHYVETASGAFVYFTVAADGTIGYDPSLEGILSGAGTNALAVNGAPITLDATALVGLGVALDGVTYDPSTPINVNLLPGSHYLQTSSGATDYFTVAADGTVSYDPALAGVLSGQGTGTLTIIQ